MEKATIKFKDGTEIEAEVNGNNYITETRPEFPEDMTEVIVVKNEAEETLKNVSIQESAGLDDRFWFIFHEATQQEITESQVFYTAMMTDTLLEG